jgi:hypothetical protein
VPRWPTMTPRKFPASCSGYGSATGALSRRRVVAVRRPKGKLTGELLQREPDLQSDLIALNLAVLNRTAHLRDFEPAEIS